MNKTTTHKDSLDVCAGLPLEDHELDRVSGGFRSEEHVAFHGGQNDAAQQGQNDPAQMFQQIMQQLTQG